MATYIAKEVLLKNKIHKYQAWLDSTTILVPGELAIVQLDVNDEHPITGKLCETSSYLIKIGDGEHTFANLPWLESSANIELYGTEAEQDYNLEEANNGTYLELVTTTGDDGIGSYAPAIKFVQQGLTEHLNVAKGYTENFAYKRDDLLKHIDKSDSKTVITYGESDPEVNFNGDIYLKTVPERLPVSNNITEYGIKTIGEQNWRYRKWEDGTVDLFTQIIIKGKDINSNFTIINNLNKIKYNTGIFNYDCPFNLQNDIDNASPIISAQLVTSLTDLNNVELRPQCSYSNDNKLNLYYTSIDEISTISDDKSILLSIYINGLMDE